jgi:hypothetical protein
MNLESNNYVNTKLVSSELMTLHRYLFKMVADDVMTTLEAENILKRAGLWRRKEPNSWTDVDGAVYTLRENI